MLSYHYRKLDEQVEKDIEQNIEKLREQKKIKEQEEEEGEDDKRPLLYLVEEIMVEIYTLSHVLL